MAKKDSRDRELDADGSVKGSGPQGAVPSSPLDVEVEQGFRGLEVDPTPNENYTAAGVTAGKPTPETDAKAAEKARERIAQLGQDLSA